MSPNISGNGVLARSLDKISVRGLLARCLTGYLGKSSTDISVQDHFLKFLYKLSNFFSWQDSCKRPLGNISATDLYAMFLYKFSKEELS